jgi:16S rRNA (guanine(966)-N(2))-methyltransferase RsmD
MRITGGTHKGRVFHFAGKKGLRPTTDFAREALFNILMHRHSPEGLCCLDLYAGTGAVSFELLSRGAAAVTCVEKIGASVLNIKKVAGELGFAGPKVVQSDVKKFLDRAGESYDFVFADPPYDDPLLPQIPRWVMQAGILRPGAWLVIEHGANTRFETVAAHAEHRQYGHVHFTFFLPEQAP